MKDKISSSRLTAPVIKGPQNVLRLYQDLKHVLETLLARNQQEESTEKEALSRLNGLNNELERYFSAYRDNPQGESRGELEKILLAELRPFGYYQPSADPGSSGTDLSIQRCLEALQEHLKEFSRSLAKNSAPAAAVPQKTPASLPPEPLAAEPEPPKDKPPPVPVPGAPAETRPDLPESAVHMKNPDGASKPAAVAPVNTEPGPAPEPLAGPAFEQPRPEGPTITIYLKTFDSGGNYLQPYDILGKLIDKEPPLNGSARAEFSYISKDDLSVDKYFKLESAEVSPELTELGLQVRLDGQRLVIEGSPSRGFEGPLNFFLTHREAGGLGRVFKKHLYIADPRSVWQTLVVEDFKGYPAPNERLLGQSLPALGKMIVAASCRGRSHAHGAKPRDDYFAIKVDVGSGWHFVAVADGAGSAKYSRKGAALACETVINKLYEYLIKPDWMEMLDRSEDEFIRWKGLLEAEEIPAEAGGELRKIFDDIMYNAVQAAYHAIAGEAKVKGAQVRDYHTTLLCAAIRKFPFGYFIVTYWVGDGGLCLYNWNGIGRVIVPGKPDGGEFAGQTRFLTMSDEITAEPIRRRTRYNFADDFEALILMTDGLTDPFFPSEKAVTIKENWQAFWTGFLKEGFDDNPGCRELFEDRASPEEKAQALRRWLDFWSKGNHDDRTILIIK